jgi:hypothetical protein
LGYVEEREMPKKWFLVSSSSSSPPPRRSGEGLTANEIERGRDALAAVACFGERI